MKKVRLSRILGWVMLGVCANNLSAQTYSSSDTPLAIPPSGTSGTTISSITVPDSIVISNLDVNVDYNHTFQGDLTGTVTSPNGTNVQLFAGSGGSVDAQNGGYLFDDDAATAFPPGSSPIANGTYRPAEPLSAFNGENALGNWTLTIDDTFGGDSGTLNVWQLFFASASGDTSGAEILASGSMIEIQATGQFLGLLANRLRGGVGAVGSRFASPSYASSSPTPAPQIRLVSTAPSTPENASRGQSLRHHCSSPQYVLVNPLRTDARKTRAWVTGYGAQGGLDHGFDYDFSGVAFGAERNIDCSTLVGIAGNYYGSNGQSDTSGVELDSLGIAFYGSRRIRSHGYLTGIMGYSNGDYSTRRSTTTGTAVGETDSDTFTSLFELGRNIHRGQTTIQPHAAFQYVGISADGFSEAGAGSANLQVADDNVNSARGMLGLSFLRSMPVAGSGTFSPFYRIAYAHEFADDNQIINAGLAGSAGPLVFQGPELGRDYIDMNVGISYATGYGLSLFADYGSQFSSELDQHTGRGGVSFAW
ncbi:autotransporter domain-containing protein [Stieleria sp. TO1_6]|uniref:autotransporter domain-containing protein n=1 Tax=Stieleria tagensis TaxID=2956795 RepID=UPI00209AE33C|nr:autotransporter domain-containing protein [Stieleria tagensis]MCO8121273.1 autotransporter domain-containing protein [Stieleria tagensis]